MRQAGPCYTIKFCDDLYPLSSEGKKFTPISNILYIMTKATNQALILLFS